MSLMALGYQRLPGHTSSTCTVPAPPSDALLTHLYPICTVLPPGFRPTALINRIIPDQRDALSPSPADWLVLCAKIPESNHSKSLQNTNSVPVFP